MALLFLHTIVVIALLVATGEGLNCYNCIYLETPLPPGINSTAPSELSCKSGNQPNESLIVNCDRLKYNFDYSEFINVAESYQSGLIENGSKLIATKNEAMEFHDGRKRNFTCAKLVFNGTFNEKYESVPFRSTIRTCIPHMTGRLSPFEEVCHHGALKDVSYSFQEPEVEEVLENYGAILNNQTTHTVACTCNEEACNGSTQLALAYIFPIAAMVSLRMLLLLLT